MTDNSDSQKTANAETSKRGKQPAIEDTTGIRPGQVRSGLALILAVIALMASGYLWYTVLYQNADLFTTDVVETLDQIATDNAQIQESIAAADKDIKGLKETQDTIRTSLEKINNDLTRNRMEWALTEAEQLLVIANNRLQLARDTHSALAALRAADQQLQQLARPKLLPVRRELAREISLIESIDKTDISGITLRLGTLADTINRLPLALEIRQRETSAEPKKDEASDKSAAKESAWRVAVHTLWQDLASLVRIRSNVEVQKPLLPPEQQYFLRENLRLALYGAQQALLQGNLPVYQQNLKSAARMTKEYFDLNSQVVISMQGELDKLLSTRIVAELPDISASLSVLRRLSGRGNEP